MSKNQKIEEKTYMFQYAYDNGIRTSFFSFSSYKIVEDTGLITLSEANSLWNEYFNDCMKRLERDERPQMCIWKNCKSINDYSEILKSIDYRDDLEIKNGHI